MGTFEEAVQLRIRALQDEIEALEKRSTALTVEVNKVNHKQHRARNLKKSLSDWLELSLSPEDTGEIPF